MVRFEFKTGGHGVVRFVYFLNYPEGTSIEDGEKWYFGKHAPEVRNLPGITSYRTWRALPPIPMGSPDPYDRFVRMSELVFANMAVCRKATIDNPGPWSAPAKGDPGFGELECMVLDDEPQFDLLKDVPVQQYKYMALPLKFSMGEPEPSETEDTVLDVYFFNYKVSVAEGEDWYLGHHVREGRLVKRISTAHYQTWKSIRMPEETGSLLRPNRFYRITELGLPEAALAWPQEGTPPRTRLLYTTSPFGNVLGEWRNIIIRPNQAQDLLE